MKTRNSIIFLGFMMISAEARCDWYSQLNIMKPIKSIGRCGSVGPDLDSNKRAMLRYQESQGLSCKSLTDAIACTDADGRGKTIISVNYFETLESCNAFVNKLNSDSGESKVKKDPKGIGWVFTKLKSDHAYEKFSSCKKVNASFEGHLASESNMWSSRGAVCVVSKFFDDSQYIFECRYPSLRNTTRYYFWHDSKAKCDARLKTVKELWKKEKWD